MKNFLQFLPRTNNKHTDMNQAFQNPQKKHIGFISHLNEVFPNKENPGYDFFALKGDILFAYKNTLTDKHILTEKNKKNDNTTNFLYSLGANHSVIATFYHIVTKKAALAHFDLNINNDTEKKINNIMERFFRHDRENIRVSLTGGVWLGFNSGPASIITRILKQRYHINPSWDHWSASNCYQHNYGTVLDLRNGNITIFEHPPVLAEQVTQDKINDNNQQIRIKQPFYENCMPDYYNMENNSDDNEKTIYYTLGIVNFSLTGRNPIITPYANEFKRHIDIIQDEMKNKSYSEIKGRVEGIKQTLTNASYITLNIDKRKPAYMALSHSARLSKSTSSVTSRSESSSQSAKSSNEESSFEETNCIESILYQKQKIKFNDDQKTIILSGIERIKEYCATRNFSNSHTMEKSLFSKADQNVIEHHLDRTCNSLYSVTLANFENTLNGRGKWRLSYRQINNAIFIMGVYDNHKTPYAAYS
ncbi:hypothetical protein ACGVWS_02360 [Enterobacteriaceae bacterium LUAb1]